jgi:hypothetical protein
MIAEGAWQPTWRVRASMLSSRWLIGTDECVVELLLVTVTSRTRSA